MFQEEKQQYKQIGKKEKRGKKVLFLFVCFNDQYRLVFFVVVVVFFLLLVSCLLFSLIIDLVL